MQLVIENAGGTPGLLGGQCRKCDFVFFPFQKLGCESCGAIGDDLTERILSSRGVVRSSVIVHVATADLAAPFGVIEVQLGEGPVIRALTHSYKPPTGTPVVGRIEAESDRSPQQMFRFVAAES